MLMCPEVRPGEDDWGTDLTVWEACVVDGAGGNLRTVVCLHGTLSVEQKSGTDGQEWGLALRIQLLTC